MIFNKNKMARYLASIALSGLAVYSTTSYTALESIENYLNSERIDYLSKFGISIVPESGGAIFERSYKLAVGKSKSTITVNSYNPMTIKLKARGELSGAIQIDTNTLDTSGLLKYKGQTMKVSGNTDTVLLSTSHASFNKSLSAVVSSIEADNLQITYKPYLSNLELKAESFVISRPTLQNIRGEDLSLEVISNSKSTTDLVDVSATLRLGSLLLQAKTNDVQATVLLGGIQRNQLNTKLTNLEGLQSLWTTLNKASVNIQLPQVARWAITMDRTTGFPIVKSAFVANAKFPQVLYHLEPELSKSFASLRGGELITYDDTTRTFYHYYSNEHSNE
ncbi:hypothetical protein [Vibrio crassostreae]|uniref:hypothetical protein n=1 Tax=Vibrio crassostreae TaxID=246167 RepID=UPI001B3006A5|nr:hypothetical protein [Vibrio crassostreae]